MDKPEIQPEEQALMTGYQILTNLIGNTQYY